MKIPTEILDMVAFLAVRDEDGLFSQIGTCFFMHIEQDDRTFSHLITCRHVIDEPYSNGTQIYIRMNKTDGTGVHYEDIPLDWNWIFHSDEVDGLVDLAVLQLQSKSTTVETYITSLPINHVFGEMSLEYDTGRPLSVGDEIIFIGLFPWYVGHDRNRPITRFGKIALRTDDKLPGVEDRLGLSDYYYVECQAYPGMSGSPVFVHKEIVGKEKSGEKGDK